MPKVEIVPFLVPDPSWFLCEPWKLGRPGDLVDLPNRILDWDPLRIMEVSRSITFDFVEIFSACGLGEESELAVAVSWGSEGTKLKELVNLVTIPFGQSRVELNISFELAGKSLAGSVDLLVRLLLKDRGKSPHRLAATLPGSILWQDMFELKLEGLGARFPMEIVDFAELGLPIHSGWFLSWRKEFHSEVMGNLCLLINEKHQRLKDAVSGGGSDPQSSAIWQTLKYQIARELVSGALSSDEFLSDYPDFERGSLGATVCLLINRYFESAPASSLRSTLEDSPCKFDCQLQHALRLFHLPQ